MGRPTKLTPELQNRVVAALQVGSTRETAARLSGIDPATFYRWIERGQKADAEAQRLDTMDRRELLLASEAHGIPIRKRESAQSMRARLAAIEEPYREFRDAVEKGLAEGEFAHLSNIYHASRGRPAQFDQQGNMLMPAILPQWTASAWTLERMYPEKYGRRQVEIAGPGGGAVRVKLDDLSDDELKAARARLRQARETAD